MSPGVPGLEWFKTRSLIPMAIPDKRFILDQAINLYRCRQVGYIRLPPVAVSVLFFFSFFGGEY